MVTELSGQFIVTTCLVLLLIENFLLMGVLYHRSPLYNSSYSEKALLLEQSFDQFLHEVSYRVLARQMLHETTSDASTRQADFRERSKEKADSHFDQHETETRICLL